jgi:hypothetical protein
VPVTEAGDAGIVLEGTLADVGPVVLDRVEGEADHRLFRELVGRYHYLGYRVPFGAHLRYLASVSAPERRLVAAVQLSSPAWRLAPRDQWIGWDDATRKRNLQRVINNSRFLVLPWVRVAHLASHVLSAVTRAAKRDWRLRYGVQPWLVETMIDASRFRGTCYRAANWIDVGQSTGRGRMDRRHERHGAAVKRVLIYPLDRHTASRLREA